MAEYTIFDVAKDLIRGKLQFAEKEVYTARLNDCKSCEVYDAAKKKCTVCGCYMPAKVRLQLSSCPMEKW